MMDDNVIKYASDAIKFEKQEPEVLEQTISSNSQESQKS
jgi:hypothetical protein